MKNDIFLNYQTASSLLCNYPVESIPTYAAKEEDCVMGDAPTIRAIQKKFGDDCMVKWMGDMLDFFMKASNIREASSVQLGMTIQIILSKYGSLKITEMMLFGFKFLSGDYEKFYGSFDTQAITRSLARFMEYRNNIIQKCEIRMKQPREPRDTGREKRLAYLTLLQKGAYGDKSALDYLRITDERTMAQAIAACVKSGEFPEKILDRIRPEYAEMVEIILHREDYEAIFCERRKQLRLQLREIDSDQSRTLEERVEAQQRLVYGDKYDAMRMVIQ